MSGGEYDDPDYGDIPSQLSDQSSDDNVVDDIDYDLEDDVDVNSHRSSSNAPRSPQDVSARFDALKLKAAEPLRQQLKDAAYSNGGGTSSWKKLFDAIDIDESGSIDAEEFLTAIRQSGIRATTFSRTSINQVFDALDPELTGFIEIDAFLKWLERPIAPHRGSKSGGDNESKIKQSHIEKYPELHHRLSFCFIFFSYIFPCFVLFWDIYIFEFYSPSRLQSNFKFEFSLSPETSIYIKLDHDLFIFVFCCFEFLF